MDGSVGLPLLFSQTSIIYVELTAHFVRSTWILVLCSHLRIFHAHGLDLVRPAPLSLTFSFILFSRMFLLSRCSSSCYTGVVSMANVSEDPVEGIAIGLERNDLSCLSFG